jgi:branched-subunit amino acid transport protein
MPEKELWLAPSNPYLIGAIAAALLAWKTKNVLLTTIVSMVLFLCLKLL